MWINPCISHLFAKMRKEQMWKTSVDKADTIAALRKALRPYETRFCEKCHARSGVRNKNEYLVQSIRNIVRQHCPKEHIPHWKGQWSGAKTRIIRSGIDKTTAAECVNNAWTSAEKKRLAFSIIMTYNNQRPQKQDINWIWTCTSSSVGRAPDS